MKFSYTSLVILASAVCYVIAVDPSIKKTLDSLAKLKPEEIDRMCKEWYKEDTGVPKSEPVLCCPKLANDIKKNTAFEPLSADDLKLRNPDADIGYRQRVPTKSGAGQRCVYKKGALLIDPPSGGSVEKVSPKTKPDGEILHFVSDTLPWISCCRSKNLANCKLYYEKRPSNTGKCKGQ